MSHAAPASLGSDSSALTVAVGGGKGGVGKSLIAANLAVAMGRLGFRVVLVDADLGAANLHTFFGIDRPGWTLQAFLDRDIDSLEEVVVPTGVSKVFLVPGSGAVAGAGNLAHGKKLKLMRHIGALEADVVVVDCGAGVSFGVLDFYSMADVRLTVATPQLISLQNAYAFVKGAVYRAMSRVADNENRRSLLARATERTETERVRDLVCRVQKEDPDFARELAHVVDHFGTSIVGNQLEERGQVNVLHALSRMVADFLDVRPEVIASLPRSSRVHASVTRRHPFVDAYPSSPEARVMDALAEKVMCTDLVRLRHGRASLSDMRAGRVPTLSQEQAEHILPGPLGSYLRRHERASVAWTATVRSRGSSYPAAIVDVSASGACITCDRDLPVGTVLQLRPQEPSLVVAAVVRNRHGGRFGLEFVGKDGAAHGERLMAAVRTSVAAVA